MNTLKPVAVAQAILPEAGASGRALQARIIAVVVALVLLIWVGVGINLFFHRQDVEKAAERNVQNLVRVIEAQVRGQLDAIDVSLLAVSKTLPLLQGRARAHDPEVHALLKALLVKSAPVRALWVTNARADMLHDSDSLTSTANDAQRPYFTQQRDQSGLGLYVGQPIVNETGVWFVGVSRRVLKPDGSFDGVVVAALEPLFFERLFATLDVGRDGALLMLTQEMNVVARVPHQDALRGQNVRGKTNLPALLLQSPEGVYRSHSAADGVARIHAYRQVGGYPMVVVAGLSQAEVLASWWRTALVVLVAAAALSALLAALGWRVLHALTTSRQLQAALQAAKGRADGALQALESVVQAIPDLIFETDLSGRIHSYRGQRSDLLYAPPSLFVGKRVQEVLPPEASAVILEALRQADVSGRHAGPLYWLDIAQRRTWFELSVARQGDGTGPDARFVMVTRDVTQRVEAARHLEDLNQQLRRSNSDLAQFAYAASHDLIEPLRSVAGSVQLLQTRYEGQLDARADTFIAHAVGGVHRMQALIEDLLAFSQISARPSAAQAVDLDVVLAHACKNLQAALTQSAAQITHDPLPTVAGDAGQLGHLVQNLLANALKFRGDKPAVLHLGARRDGAQWVCWVADQGIGIAPQYFERIFGIFKRLHTREEYAGNGIGLTLCQRIVERHGGRIWVESEPGQGATFFFSLPAMTLSK